MLNFLKPIWLTILKWSGIVGGILLLLAKVKQSGKDEEDNKLIKNTLKEVQVRDKIENDIASAGDAKLNSLHKRWTKD